MHTIRPSTLSTFSRKISYVFIFCGLLLCFLVISMRNSSMDTANIPRPNSPRFSLQVPDEIKHPIPPPSFDMPLPPGNVRPIQDLLIQQAKDQLNVAEIKHSKVIQYLSTPSQEKMVTTSVEETTTENIKTTEASLAMVDADIDNEDNIEDNIEDTNEDNTYEMADTAVETIDGNLEVLKLDKTSSNNTQILFKDLDCGNSDAKRLWCTVDPPEDLMQITLPPFLKEYKNPCWKAKPSEGYPPIRCLPYFFLIGAPKSGTTDLFNRMIQHPDISSLVKKEIHWFSRRRYMPRESKSLPHIPMLSNYTDLFKEADEDLLSNTDFKGYHNKVFGDSSVSTLWDNTNAVRYSLLSKTEVPRTAECIHHLNPHTKFVSIIRDPIQRTYSDFLYFGSFPDKSQASFHKHVVNAIEFHKECTRHYSLMDCIDYRNGHDARLYVGIYHQHFEEYFKFFPKEQFIILKLEDYSTQMPKSLAKVFSFLGLAPLSEAQMNIVSDQSTIYNTRPSSGVKLGDMWPETRMLLADFFRPYNEKLGELLGSYYNYNKHSVK